MLVFSFYQCFISTVSIFPVFLKTLLMVFTIPKGSWTHKHTYLCRYAYTHTQTCTWIHSGTDTFIHTPHVHTQLRHNHTQTSPGSYFLEQFPCLYSSPQHRDAVLLVFCPTHPLILSDVSSSESAPKVIYIFPAQSFPCRPSRGV